MPHLPARHRTSASTIERHASLLEPPFSSHGPGDDGPVARKAAPGDTWLC